MLRQRTERGKLRKADRNAATHGRLPSNTACSGEVEPLAVVSRLPRQDLTAAQADHDGSAAPAIETQRASAPLNETGAMENGMDGIFRKTGKAGPGAHSGSPGGPPF